jgi:hypothetical protein
MQQTLHCCAVVCESMKQYHLSVIHSVRLQACYLLQSQWQMVAR